jgi:hypothetical protein
VRSDCRGRLGTKLISLLLVANAVLRHPAFESRVLSHARRGLRGRWRRTPEIGTSLRSLERPGISSIAGASPDSPAGMIFWLAPASVAGSLPELRLCRGDPLW